MKNSLSYTYAKLVIIALVWFSACKPDEPDFPVVSANFSADNTTIEEGESVSFTDNSTGNPTKWSWTFEGGTPTSSTSQSPSVVYNTAGTYEVSLTAANEDNSDTEAKSEYITVFKGMQADFIASDTTISAESTITFTDQSIGEPTQWEWTFEGGDPTSSTDKNPEVSYSNPGTYEVSLTATNANTNDTETKSAYIRVFELINADFIADNTEIDEGGSISFTDQSEGTPAEWAWTFEGGTPASSTEQNPTITYDTPGTYEVTLTASNADTSGTITKTEYITVNSVISLEQGLVAFYPFNGNADDESGNGNDGNVVGDNLLVNDRFNTENSAFSFDGIDDLIMLPDNLLDHNSVSFNVWLKTDDQTFSIISGANNDNHNEFLVYAHESHGSYIELYYHDNSGLGGNNYYTSNVLVNDDQWHMLSIVVTTETTLIYVDAILIESATYGSLYTFDIEGLWLGGDQDIVDGGWQADQQFEGIMDDIRIYNRPLNEDEIEMLYDE